MSGCLCPRTEVEQCLGSEALHQLCQKNFDPKALPDLTYSPHRWSPTYQAKLNRQWSTQQTSMSAPASPSPTRRSYGSNVAWYPDKEFLAPSSELLRPLDIQCKGSITRPNASPIKNDQNQHIQNVSKGSILKSSCNIARLHIQTEEYKMKWETGYEAYSVLREESPGRTYNKSRTNKNSNCRTVDSDQVWKNSACRSTQPFVADGTVPVPSSSSAVHQVRFPTADIPQDFPQPKENHIIEGTNSVSNPFFHCRQWLKGVSGDQLDDHCNGGTALSYRKFQIVEKHPLSMLETYEEANLAEVSEVNYSWPMKNSWRECSGAHQEQLTSNLPKCLQVGQAFPISDAPVEPIAHMTPPTSLPKAVSSPRQDACPSSSRDTPLDVLLWGSSMPERAKTLKSCQGSDVHKALTQSESSRHGCVKSATSSDLPKPQQGQRKTVHQAELRFLNPDSEKAITSKSTASELSSKLNGSEIGNRRYLRFKQPQEDHIWTLRELELFVKHFPRHLPVLTSPVIAFLRKSKEGDLLGPLRAIFPMAAEKVLSSLCAAVIARNYLFSISQFDRQRSLWKCHKIPTLRPAATKAGNNLGAQSLCLFDQDGYQVLNPRSARIGLEIDKIVHHLIFTVVGRFDKSLKSTVEVLVGVLETNASN